MDLINANLGIGFSIPICLTKHSDILSSHDIVRVFGAFDMFFFLSSEAIELT